MPVQRDEHVPPSPLPCHTALGSCTEAAHRRRKCSSSMCPGIVCCQKGAAPIAGRRCTAGKCPSVTLPPAAAGSADVRCCSVRATNQTPNLVQPAAIGGTAVSPSIFLLSAHPVLRKRTETAQWVSFIQQRVHFMMHLIMLQTAVYWPTGRAVYFLCVTQPGCACPPGLVGTSANKHCVPEK